MKEGFSKTAFIVIAFLCGIMIITSPIIGLISGKILGAIAIGWVISGIILGILIGVIYEQKLNDDFQWKFSKKEENSGGVEL
jgi:hypothetical protein